MIDVADPIHYARHIIAEPREGASARSIYMTEGINPDGTGDSYAPPHGIEAHALAIGLPLQLPDQRAITEGQWGGPTPVLIDDLVRLSNCRPAIVRSSSSTAVKAQRPFLTSRGRGSCFSTNATSSATAACD